MLIFILTFSINVFSENNADYWEKRLKIDITESAFPIIPSMSKIQITLPVSEIDFVIWYLASSAFFIPDPFMETGLTINYSFLRKSNYRISAGIGSAFSTENDILSIPFILDVKGEVFFNNWFMVEADFLTLIYGEGLIVDNAVMAVFDVLDTGFTASIGPGFTAGYSWNYQLFDIVAKIALGVGYRF